jgi:multidrug efflux pump subunit AcrB
MRVRVDQARARQLGISSTDLAQALDTVTRGLTITQVLDDVYLIDVVARAIASDRESLEALRDLQLPLANGQSVPLSEISTFEYTLEQPVLWRRDRIPTVTVQADVAADIQPDAVNAELAPQIAKVAAQLPPGYSIATGGIKEESDRALRSVLGVVPVMVVLMLTILMAQLQSFRRLVLVVSVVPLGLIGIVAIMLPTHMPIGFVAILGVIALTGMIIRNSVILIDQIARNVAAGESDWDAVLNATLHRLRPILLTAGAAILAMLPIARDVFWGPMAFAIIGGLAGATVLTLIFLPPLYVAWFGISEPIAAPTARAVDAAAR